MRHHRKPPRNLFPSVNSMILPLKPTVARARKQLHSFSGNSGILEVEVRAKRYRSFWLCWRCNDEIAGSAVGCRVLIDNRASSCYNSKWPGRAGFCPTRKASKLTVPAIIFSGDNEWSASGHVGTSL